MQRGDFDDSALVGALHRSRVRGVLAQGNVGSGAVVIDEVVATGDVDGFRSVPPRDRGTRGAGPDEAFHVGILPRGPRRDLHLVDPQGLNSAGEHDSVDGIAVAQQVT